MTTREELVAEYNEWLAERSSLAGREAGGDSVSSGEWQGSDDEGLRLLHQFATFVQADRRPGEIEKGNGK